MKRWYLFLVVFFVSFWTACSSPMGKDETDVVVPDPEAAVLLSCNVASGLEIEFEFSAPVRVIWLEFSPSLEVESIGEGSTVKVRLAESLRPGILFTADILAADEWGNDISVQASFEVEAPALEFLACNVVSGLEIEFEFSVPVTVISLEFSPGLEIESIEEGGTVRVRLSESLKPGLRIAADILVQDEFEQILNSQSSFSIKNNRLPQLLINELRTEYSKPKAEFIEFKMESDGNLGALRVFVAGNNKVPLVYEFQPVEVQAGDYVVLHLRTLDNLCVDEYGDSLDESGGTDSSPTARDFWVPGSAKLLRKTDAVYVTDQDGQVLDAVMISEDPDPAWKNNYLVEAAEFLFRQGAWKSPAGNVCSPADAASSANIKASMTRSISRDETLGDTGTAADWYVTVNGGATPGRANNPNRF